MAINKCGSARFSGQAQAAALTWLHVRMLLLPQCDVVVTKDQKLVCRHEPMLELTTDAMDKFPDRVKTYNLPEAGGNITGG